ncbi:4-phosphoerythronate dehydrogenase [Legionella shakespearei]|uniref:Erythronate-4-phosphate dehydrogenase n=1 Tax=Legionella shakespearei DSM 23087 TaxID=1122169 RepID=A0A0W0YM21_9GAMM|nr:4-phosphoerythronate dehydrogenase [Legionella shakespearei]KTD57946.1 erythronate-4-phosphate dehydrogenase [Legionella shakespearei DSM 23087]
MNILADASLPGLDAAFPAPFHLSLYHSAEEISSKLAGQDVLLCRSTLKVDSSLLKGHQLKFVATASSGTDHLDEAFLKSEGIEMIDAKGCNAPSVGDYVLATLAYLDQQQLIKGKTAGIVGMGRVGTEVYDRLAALNLDIHVYDPPRAERDRQFKSCALSDLFQVDILCIHAELHQTQPYPSFNLFHFDVLSQLKPECIIINAARGGIVNEEDLLRLPQSLIYCTDVYSNEPEINAAIINRATLCTPHIAGHSLEAKYNAVSLVSARLHRIARLPYPQFARPNPPEKAVIEPNKPWQEIILSLYNPIDETLSLKEASDKTAGFLSLRKQHQNRHDFTHYFD